MRPEIIYKKINVKTGAITPPLAKVNKARPNEIDTNA